MTQGRGGRRSGAPGAAYPNRTDLSSGPGYGAGVAAERSLQAVPAGPSPAAQVPAGAAPSGSPQGPPPGQAPGELPDLMAPTNNPDEPLTAGNPLGAGPGPAAPTAEQQILASHVGWLSAAINDPDCPPSVANVLRWIKSQAAQ